MKILIVEDEKELSRSIKTYLTLERYVCENVFDYSHAFEKIQLYTYDCIIIDITLPGGNGLDLITLLKKMQPDTGVIVISARNSLDDKIKGLEIGADDYLTKPFHLSELNARIKSILRRRNFEGSNEFCVNEITINPDSFQVFVNHHLLNLTPKEFDLLLYLVSNQNKVITKESIAEHLWGDDIDMADTFDFVYTHIKNIRKKIIKSGGHDYIKTVYGLGYVFKTNEIVD
ncbi:MAG: response regulator transcription factor [Bacteroidota bacterium]|nr:response regulator transcription factor [Bacteroidota bacterium]